MNRITKDKIDKVVNYLGSIENWDQAPENKWNAKEIVGHLIDSGVNNLYRYQRILINDETQVAAYSQDALVAWQKYSAWDEARLIQVWQNVNELIVNFISPISESQLTQEVTVGSEILTLEGMLLDYIQHIDLHIKQITALQS